MIIKLDMPDDATVGDLITILFPHMCFKEKCKNLMANYFEDIKIKRNTWDEKLDLDRLKESGILAEDKHKHWVGTSYDGFADGYPVYDEFECSKCGARMYEELKPETTTEISIDKTIEIFEGIKEGICPWYPELYYDKAINTMRKYQRIEQIYQKWNEVNDFSYNQAMRMIGEVVEDGNDN